MQCVLMESNGLRGDCSTTGCVYWALLSGPDEAPRRGCALDFFGLVGPQRDVLSKWLLQLKLKNRVGRHSEMTLTGAYTSRAHAPSRARSPVDSGYSASRDRPASARA